MLLIKQKGPSCLITSAAMVFNDPHLAQSFKDPIQLHIQEIIDYAWFKLDIPLLHVEAAPHLNYKEDPTNPISTTAIRDVYGDKKLERIKAYLANHRAILIYENHACAWDGQKVYNPRGYISDDLNTENLVEVYIVP